jgi:hypothetical protein
LVFIHGSTTPFPRQAIETYSFFFPRWVIETLILPCLSVLPLAIKKYSDLFLSYQTVGHKTLLIPERSCPITRRKKT